ncbi:beta-L-arabinofuranosidase domain-containing protein [Lentzea sp. NPDC004782]|uniref:beta-L-arabinofuranosidase domain-containing protein n=1 Tax=Lentzea sp. NPDC004782 TaxID=3154458 RepID=UPI0033A2DEBA
MPEVVLPRVAAARADFGVSAEPFPLGAVMLLPGPLRDNASRVHARLRLLDPDRLLHTFRRNVGLPSGVVPCGGSEAPASHLRGQSAGHVLSALAQAFATTGDRMFSVRANYLVEQLALCQDRARIAGYSTGYLSAFPEGFLGAAEARQPVRAPYHTLHRIMAGLLDVHRLLGNAQALTVATRMAAWAAWRIGRLPAALRREVLATEPGGMHEVLANLYQLTGDPAHLITARYFEVEHVSSFTALGAIRAYHATGTARYRDAALDFWRTAQHSDHLCETYNVLRLARELFRADPGQARYFDHYEKALHLLAVQDTDDFTCCHGTGLEAGTRHGDSIYFHAGPTLYVNLFVPSVLTWAGRGISVRQEPSATESIKLTIGGSGRIDLRVRVPSHVVGAGLRVNGVASRLVTPGTYARIDRHWANGDVVSVPTQATFQTEDIRLDH